VIKVHFRDLFLKLFFENTEIGVEGYFGYDACLFSSGKYLEGIIHLFRLWLTSSSDTLIPFGKAFRIYPEKS